MPILNINYGVIWNYSGLNITNILILKTTYNKILTCAKMMFLPVIIKIYSFKTEKRPIYLNILLFIINALSRIKNIFLT